MYERLHTESKITKIPREGDVLSHNRRSLQITGELFITRYLREYSNSQRNGRNQIQSIVTWSRGIRARNACADRPRGHHSRSPNAEDLCYSVICTLLPSLYTLYSIPPYSVVGFSIRPVRYQIGLYPRCSLLPFVVCNSIRSKVARTMRLVVGHAPRRGLTQLPKGGNRSQIVIGRVNRCDMAPIAALLHGKLELRIESLRGQSRHFIQRSTE